MKTNVDNLNETKLREIAIRRVTAKSDFKINCITYAVVNAGLFILYAVINWGGHPWFIWPMIGWGIGVIVHYFIMRKALDGTSVDKVEREIEIMKRK